MNYDQLKAMYEAWEAIASAEETVFQYIDGTADEESLDDLLGELTERRSILGALLSKELGEPVEDVQAQILAKQRAVLLGEGGAQ